MGKKLKEKMHIENSVFDRLKKTISIQDNEFDRIYQESIKILSDLHWTPVDVAVKASKLLVTSKETKVLDIGSGVGKFCLIGATTTDGFFTGVEQRELLVNISKKISETYSVANTEFIHSNVTEIDFSNYDSFYFFNSFYENIVDMWPKIDSSVELSLSNYKKYNRHLYNELEKLKSGTRVVTYCVSDKNIPDNYLLEDTYFDRFMKFWIKE